MRESGITIPFQDIALDFARNCLLNQDFYVIAYDS